MDSLIVFYENPWLLALVVIGLAAGALWAWRMRQRSSALQQTPTALLLAGGGVLGGALLGILAYLILLFLSPRPQVAIGPTFTPTNIPPSPSPIRPTRVITSTLTATPTLTPTIARRLTATPTLTPTVPAISLVEAGAPVEFTITLVFTENTTCSMDGFEYDYVVTLEADAISMLQSAAGITNSGPYDPDSGEFTAVVGGLPGTETYTGVVAITAQSGGSSYLVGMKGAYTYTDDPGFPCTEGEWPFSGETTYTP